MNRIELEDMLYQLLPLKAQVVESRINEARTEERIVRLRQVMMESPRRTDELGACCYVAGEIDSACAAIDRRFQAGIFYGMAASLEGQLAGQAALDAATIMYMKYDRPFETWLAACLARIADNFEVGAGHTALLASRLRKRSDFYARSRELTFSVRRDYPFSLSMETKGLAEVTLPPLASLKLPELRELHAYFADDGVPSGLTAEDRRKLAVYVCWGEFILAGFEAGLSSALDRAALLSLHEPVLREFRTAYELMDCSTSPQPEEDLSPYEKVGEAPPEVRSSDETCYPPERTSRRIVWQGPPRRLHFEYAYRIEPQYTVDWDGESGLLVFSSSVHGVASAKLVVGEEMWREFWKFLQQAKVWEWQDNYELTCEDGYHWSFELEQGAMTINSQGSNANPGHETAKGPFRLLLRALENLSRYAVPMTYDRPDH